METPSLLRVSAQASHGIGRPVRRAGGRAPSLTPHQPKASPSVPTQPTQPTQPAKGAMRPSERIGAALMVASVAVNAGVNALADSRYSMPLVVVALLTPPAFITGAVLFFLGRRDRRQATSGTPYAPPAGPGLPPPRPAQLSARRTTGDVLTSFGAVGCVLALLAALRALTAGDSSEAMWVSFIATVVAMLIGLPAAVMLVAGLWMRRRPRS